MFTLVFIYSDMKKQHKHLFSLQTLLCLFFSLSLSCALAQQRSSFEALNTSAAGPQNTSMHVVKRGETLYGISKRYGMTVNELRSLNRLRSNLIKTGQTLLVHAPQQSRGTTQPPAQLARGAAPTTAEAGVVISPVDEIDVELEILAGTRVVEPVKPSAADRVLPPVAPLTALPKKLKVEKKRYYQVQPGDDLYSIADAFEVSADELRDWNAIATVSPGQVIIVDKWYEEIDREETRQLAIPELATPEPIIDSPDEAFEFMLKRAKKRGGLPAEQTAHFSRLDQGSTRGLAPAPPGTIYEAADWTYGLKAESGPYLEYYNEDINDLRFYATHPSLPIGSKVKMHLPDNPGFVELVIVGRLQGGTNAVVGLSPACVQLLKRAGKRTVTIRY
ncbi:MAG: LysM peptidoglycan-binding domain-containing protein [Bacteroidetes bacterium]|nr:MAG: LysM peptidoglycan-binding domain-containing protein [Bacteroidota bacterium]